jgi:hypothetical protein
MNNQEMQKLYDKWQDTDDEKYLQPVLNEILKWLYNRGRSLDTDEFVSFALVFIVERMQTYDIEKSNIKTFLNVMVDFAYREFIRRLNTEKRKKLTYAESFDAEREIRSLHEIIPGEDGVEDLVVDRDYYTAKYKKIFSKLTKMEKDCLKGYLISGGISHHMKYTSERYGYKHSQVANAMDRVTRKIREERKNESNN